MNRTIVFMGLTCITFPTSIAQEDRSIWNQAMGGPRISIALVNVNTLVEVGGQGGFLIADHFMVGAAGVNGWGSVRISEGASPSEVEYGYGGLLLGWLPGQSRIRPVAHLLAGVGGYSIKEHLGGGTYSFKESGGLVILSELGCILIVHHHVALMLSAGNAFADWPGWDLSGPRFSFAVSFGNFNPR